MILTGNVLLEFQELEGAGNFILPSDAPLSGECFDSFQELAAEGRKHDALMIGPICHPGEKASLRTAAILYTR